MKEQVIALGDHRLVFRSIGKGFKYIRYEGNKSASESLIVTDSDETHIGIFPNPPVKIPKEVANKVYIKFKVPVIVDNKSVAILYSKIPIEIGVYRQRNDEELLIDTFSLAPPRYALYGSPEHGFICRYIEANVVEQESTLEVTKYQEAKLRIRVANDIDNVIKITKLVIPIEDMVLEHQSDDVWVPGTAEMKIDTAFGKDVVAVKLSDTKVKRIDKTSAAKTEETLVFSMDSGY